MCYATASYFIWKTNTKLHTRPIIEIDGNKAHVTLEISTEACRKLSCG